MTVKLLTEHHLELLSLKKGCRGSSESTLVKMSNCWKSPAAAQLCKWNGGESVNNSYWGRGRSNGCFSINNVSCD